MQLAHIPFANPLEAALRLNPDLSLACFCPGALAAQAHRFQSKFPGLVTYAVKANPAPEVLETLAAAGIRAFDVASLAEMAAVRAVAPTAILHYHNPVRSVAEVAGARRHSVASWSVDSVSELKKIAPGPGDEIAVRLALSVDGGAYDFGSKFGAGPDRASHLLRRVAASGAKPSMTFHPGTQCAEPAAWVAYIYAAARVAAAAGVTLYRLNVGGGFAANRDGRAQEVEAVFAVIATAVEQAFDSPPALVCEPGRAMVSDAVTLITRVKAIRGQDAVFLNDGLYGGLAEMRDMAAPRRMQVFSPNGRARQSSPTPRVVFGPTCDSVDRLPGEVALPTDLAEGDFVFWPGMGAYAAAMNTAFNGYGIARTVTVEHSLSEAGQSDRNP